MTAAHDQQTRTAQKTPQEGKSLQQSPEPFAQRTGPGLLPEVPEVEILTRFEDRSDWSTFQRLNYRVRRPGRDWVQQEREFLDRGDAVALLPFCAETGNVLLTRQFRMPVYAKRPEESVLLEVCGGILDDADPTVTVRREAMEELGLELQSCEQVFASYSTPGSVCEKVYSFLAPYTAAQRRFTGGGLPHEGEEIEVVELPFREVIGLVHNGGIRDTRTVALVLYLAADGRCMV